VEAQALNKRYNFLRRDCEMMKNPAICTSSVSMTGNLQISPRPFTCSIRPFKSLTTSHVSSGNDSAAIAHLPSGAVELALIFQRNSEANALAYAEACLGLIERFGATGNVPMAYRDQGVGASYGFGDDSAILKHLAVRPSPSVPDLQCIAYNLRLIAGKNKKFNRN
jgi:hypothetical protein